MKLFWIFMVASLISVAWFVYSSLGIDPLIFIIFIDIMSVWFFVETRQENNLKGLMMDKIEMLEKLTSELFEKLNGKNSHADENGKDIIKWLDKF